jgi:predicted DsbA family dithiol-disulfide isomerase
MEQSSLVRLREEFEIEVEWRGFELHPETPIGGVSVTKLFPGRSLASMRRRMSSFAAEFGVEMEVPEHLSNTRRALAMAEFARDRGRLEEFRQSATEGYWRRGLDLEDEKHLGEMAIESGLDPQEALDASTSAAFVDTVARTREEGMDKMVSGVPTLLLGSFPIVGCQRYETFQMIARRMLAKTP